MGARDLGVALKMANVSSVFLFLQIFFFAGRVFCNQYDPQPNPDSVVKTELARFTILTPRLIRMEWGQSLNAATFTFINRNLEKPQFTVKKNGSWTYIKTDYLEVRTLILALQNATLLIVKLMNLI